MGVPRIEDDTIITWLDLETTDLLESRPDILELGIVLTRGPGMEIIDELELLTYNPELGVEGTRERTADVPRSMHQESGLWDAHSDPGSAVLPYPEVEQLALDLLHRNGAGKGYMGGASITFDRTLLSWHMPRLLGALSYRSLDISSLAMFMSTVVDDLPYIGNKAPHRAIGDLYSNIYQVLVYRDMVQGKPIDEMEPGTRRELGQNNQK